MKRNDYSGPRAPAEGVACISMGLSALRSTHSERKGCTLLTWKKSTVKLN